MVRGRRKNRMTESRDYKKGTTKEISETQSRVENENKKRKVENRKNENERGAGGFV